MASVAAYDSLKSAIQNGISPTPVLDFDQIETAIQQDTTAFTVMEEIAQLEDLAAFGGNLCHRESGVIRVHSFTAAPQSSSAARQLAENVQDLLRAQVFSNGLRVFEVSPPESGAANNGIWTIYATDVNYELDTVRAHPAPIA